jgi:hypothetical protein
MHHRLLATAVLCALSAAAQSRPDFSGSWKLNPAKSDFGSMPGVDSRTDLITQTADTLTDKVSAQTEGGPLDLNLTYKLDGTPTVNQFQGNDVKSKAQWDGSTLVVDSQFSFNDSDIQFESRWTLSPDGKTLTMATHINSPMGESDQKYVLDKQEAPTSAAAPAPSPAANPAPAATPATAALPPPSPAAVPGPHPNFSGKWKLDVAKSDFGPLPPPDSRTDIISQDGITLKDVYVQTGGDGDQKGELNYTTDGKLCQNKFRDTDMTGTAVWDPTGLLIDNKLNFNGNDIEAKTHWELSPDGHVLTITAHVNTPMGELEQKLLFTKESD